MRPVRGASAFVLAAVVAMSGADTSNVGAPRTGRRPPRHRPTLLAPRDFGDSARHARSRCEGARDPLPDVLLYSLRAAPFPGSDHPDVAVHVPPGFDGTLSPGLIAYFHGFENCVANVVGAADSPCTPDGPVRDATHLAEQLDAAHVNAILVAIEGRYDVQAGDPGQLLSPGNFRELLHELLTEHLDEALGCELDVDDLERVVLSSHSGGYQAVSAVLQFGDVEQITEVQLFDSLYGEQAIFDTWLHDNATRFDHDHDEPLRFVNVYTCCGGTQEGSRALAASAAAALAQVGLDSSLYDDDTLAPVGAPEWAHPVVFKQSELPHGDVPKHCFRPLVEASGFAPLFP